MLTADGMPITNDMDVWLLTNNTVHGPLKVKKINEPAMELAVGTDTGGSLMGCGNEVVYAIVAGAIKGLQAILEHVSNEIKRLS